MTDLEKTKERFGQEANLEKLKKLPSITEFLTVMMTNKTDAHGYDISCQLVPNDLVEACLKKPTIEQSLELMTPGTGDFEGLRYFRYGNDEGRETLVVKRHFNYLHPEIYEISEEFRYFHNLYHDDKTNKFFKIDKDGNDELVCIITDDSVQIRMREIRQFLAIKEMYLVVQFDYSEYSLHRLDELNIQSQEPEMKRAGLMCWDISYHDLELPRLKGKSRLRGKIIVSPLPKIGAWEFEPE